MIDNVSLHLRARGLAISMMSYKYDIFKYSNLLKDPRNPLFENPENLFWVDNDRQRILKDRIKMMLTV